MNIFENKMVEQLTFFQWLNIYELMTRREFKELPEYKQENYRTEYEIYLNCKYRPADDLKG